MLNTKVQQRCSSYKKWQNVEDKPQNQIKTIPSPKFTRKNYLLTKQDAQVKSRCQITGDLNQPSATFQASFSLIHQ
jgi:hypothetical protein